MMTLVGPICYLSDIFRKQKIGFLFELLTFVLRIAGLAVGIWRGNFLIAVIGYSTGGFVAIFAQLVWYFGLIGKYENGVKATPND